MPALVRGVQGVVLVRHVLTATLGCAASSYAHADPAATPIQHVIIIMQENRSFDSYFGTYPGANGLDPSVCLPINLDHPAAGCVKPFHDQNDANAGSAHTSAAAMTDLGDGITRARNDGFVMVQDHAKLNGKCKKDPTDPLCVGTGLGLAQHDVMGYHTGDEIPNYWQYARNFVLQDAMFPGVRSWSLPAHLDLVSEWVATCTNPVRALSCTTTTSIAFGHVMKDQFPWVSLFQLFDVHGVTWKYYLVTGAEPDCADDEMECQPVRQKSQVPSIWNPGPGFTYVKAQGAAYRTQHFAPMTQLATDITNGKLPQASWVIPDFDVSEHPPSSIAAGMVYVTSIINMVMASPYWNNTAIFVAWDDWGGFYDHVVPPIADMNATKTPVQGFGIRVPGLMISTYAKPGYIDHAIYSDDSYATLLEDWFAGGARLNPSELGNPDHRPTIRDALTSVTTIKGKSVPLGDLRSEFDFTQTPLRPLILSTLIPTNITATCSVNAHFMCTSPTVTIAWAPVVVPPGSSVTYGVVRDGTRLPGCTGKATTCTDQPGKGTHYYRAYSIDATGIASPLSPAAEAIEP
jgi:phospholipase C